MSGHFMMNDGMKGVFGKAIGWIGSVDG